MPAALGLVAVERTRRRIGRIPADGYAPYIFAHKLSVTAHSPAPYHPAMKNLSNQPGGETRKHPGIFGADPG
jgi:hypothetical protein